MATPGTPSTFISASASSFQSSSSFASAPDFSQFSDTPQWSWLNWLCGLERWLVPSAPESAFTLERAQTLAGSLQNASMSAVRHQQPSPETDIRPSGPGQRPLSSDRRRHNVLCGDMESSSDGSVVAAANSAHNQTSATPTNRMEAQRRDTTSAFGALVGSDTDVQETYFRPWLSRQTDSPRLPVEVTAIPVEDKSSVTEFVAAIAAPATPGGADADQALVLVGRSSVNFSDVRCASDVDCFSDCFVAASSSSPLPGPLAALDTEIQAPSPDRFRSATPEPITKAGPTEPTSATSPSAEGIVAATHTTAVPETATEVKAIDASVAENSCDPELRPPTPLLQRFQAAAASRDPLPSTKVPASIDLLSAASKQPRNSSRGFELRPAKAPPEPPPSPSSEFGDDDVALFPFPGGGLPASPAIRLCVCVA